MLERIPTENELAGLLGSAAFAAWQEIVAHIGENYTMDTLWDSGRKAGKYELKFRKGGKTLCALYARENGFGFMIIFGGKERDLFEEGRDSFPETIRQTYDEAKTYHDGKWIMIDVCDSTQMQGIKAMLGIKKKPKKQATS